MLGNGPSLRNFDFNRLCRFDVFGMNAAYRYWYEINWFPQYYSCLDLVLGISHKESIADMIINSERIGIRAFLLRQNLIHELEDAGTYENVFNFDVLRPGFDKWIPDPVTTGSHTCAWASILGYRDIYLLGVDCNYVEIVDNAEHLDGTVLQITSDAPNPNYFFDSYQQKGDKYNIPNTRKDLHLESWRNVGKRIEVKSRVLNANWESKVDAFPFVFFEDVEKGGRIPVYSQEKVIDSNRLPEEFDHVFVPSRVTDKENTTSAYKSVKTENRLIEDRNLIIKKGSIISYDSELTDMTLTEKHAFRQANKILFEVDGATYLGFPWTMLIEKRKRNEHLSDFQKEIVQKLKAYLIDKKYVVTVCEHPDMLNYQKLFIEIGVTHVFWTHAGKGKDCFPDREKITIYPFPMLPLQTAFQPLYADESNEYLYSFVESKGNNKVLKKIKKMILDDLTNKKGSYVVPRLKWDFEEVLFCNKTNPKGEKLNILIDRSDQFEMGDILKRSIFSICPISSGHYLERLWKSISNGSIPVVISDNYHPPGVKTLWEAATVSCPERKEDILALPEKLKAIADDEELLNRKRNALRLLCLKYGPSFFIYDIQKLFFSFAKEFFDPKSNQPYFSYLWIHRMADKINQEKNPECSMANVFILGCISRLMSNPLEFVSSFKQKETFRIAVKQAITICNHEYAAYMYRAIKLKNIVLEFDQLDSSPEKEIASQGNKQ